MSSLILPVDVSILAYPMRLYVKLIRQPLQQYLKIKYIQSLLSLVCSGPPLLLPRATHITIIPTKITTIVAPIGTAIFRSTQSGIQGNKNCFTSGISLAGGGAMVAVKRKKKNTHIITFMMWRFPAQNTYNDYSDNYNQDCG